MCRRPKNKCIGWVLFLFNWSSIIDFRGATPVPVAMKRTFFDGLEVNLNFPFGPMNSISTPGVRVFSQQLPRPFGISFMQSSNLFPDGAEEMEYARKHGFGSESQILIVMNCPASKMRGSAVSK